MKKLTLSFKGGYDIYSKLEKATRDQADYIRNMNKTFADLGKNTKDAVKELTNLASTAAKTTKGMDQYALNLAKYNSNLKQIDDLNNKRINAAKDLLAAEADLAKARKNKKNTTDAKQAVATAASQVKAFDDAIRLSNENLKEATEELDQFIDAIVIQNKTTNALNKEQIEYLANYKNLNVNSKEYVETMALLEESTKALDNGINHTAAALKSSADKIAGAFDNFRASIGKAALELLTKGPAVAFTDFLSQLKYNVNQSDYTHDIGLGMSESERDKIIGENRIGLRVLGNGNEQQGLDTGGGRQIQRAAWQYGVQGAAAEQLGLQYQSQLMQSGFKGTASDTADQMTIMHNFAKQIGITDESLKDYNDSLIQSGKMAELNNRYANLDDESRRKAVNQEIITRAKLNTELGLSIERQKQINQEDINKRYSGIAATVMRGIAADTELNNYNSDNPDKKITGDRAARAKQYYQTGQMGDGWTVDQQKDARNDSDLMKANAANRLGTAAGKGTNSLIGEQARTLVPLQAMGVDVQGEGTQAQNDLLARKAVQGSKITTNDSYSDLQKNIIDSTNNAFIPFNQAMLDATQRAQGFLKNPGGAAIGTAANGLGNFAGSLLGSYLGNAGGSVITKGASALGRGAGALGRGAAGAIDSVAATGGVEVGELATAGMAGIVPIVVGVLGAAAVGVAIGSIINHFLQGTKLGDAIGAGGAHIMAALGSKDAQDALDNNAAADKANKATDARMAQLNAVTQAEKAAVTGRGTANEADLHQKAEELRAAYKQQYGVDLTGASVGYDTSKIGPTKGTPSNPSTNSVDPTTADASQAPTATNPTANNPVINGGINPKAISPDVSNPQKTLSDLTKMTDDMANQAGASTDPNIRMQVTQMEKMIKILQDQLDLAKKADQKSDQADADQKGSTWKMYADHITQVRQGLS
jgi:hypothetical protein